MVLVWQITDDSPNLPNFLPAKLSCYTVCYIFEVAILGVLQLPNSATTSQWNVVQLPIGMQLIVKPTM